jgi:hypothetical protein
MKVLAMVQTQGKRKFHTIALHGTGPRADVACSCAEFRARPVGLCAHIVRFIDARLGGSRAGVKFTRKTA